MFVKELFLLYKGHAICMTYETSVELLELLPKLGSTALRVVERLTVTLTVGFSMIGLSATQNSVFLDSGDN